jgi:hypothetical protein
VASFLHDKRQLVVDVPIPQNDPSHAQHTVCGEQVVHGGALGRLIDREAIVADVENQVADSHLLNGELRVRHGASTVLERSFG